MANTFYNWHEAIKTFDWGSGPGNLDTALFRKRIFEMARYITAEDKSVMDLGAGVMYLRAILNENIKYYPVDIEKNAKKLSYAILIKMNFQKLKRMLPF